MINPFSKKFPLSFHPRDYSSLPYLTFWTSLLGVLALYAMRPIRDCDFWWHLKSGDLMLQQQGLLKSDPFNYTGDGIVRGFQAVLLKGYWLWELTASICYNAFGFYGIYLIKLVTVALLVGAFLHEMLRQRLSQFTTVILTGLGAVVIVNVYNLERPQLFSIIFMTLLIGMIARIRQGDLPSPMLFPIMLLWANIHRGFVVGDILLVLTALGFMVQFWHEKRRRNVHLAWAFCGILVSLINPNGWTTITELYNFMQNSIGPANVTEYRSSLQLFLTQSKMAAICLWILAAIHLAGLLLVPRRFWPEIFVSVFIIAFGLAYIRNTGFIAVSLLPMTGWYAEQAYDRFGRPSPRYFKTVTCSVIVLVILWLGFGEMAGRKGSQGPVLNNFPISMGNFLQNSGLSGNLFNEYDDGGYLDWALYPQWKTFIDGRELDTGVSKQYLKIAAGLLENVDGKPYYEVMLDRYQIDVVALKIGFSDGRLQPLLKLLLNRPDWTPVYLDNLSFVLARNTMQNAAAIQRYGMDKTDFVDLLTKKIGDNLTNSPNSRYLAVLYADVLIYVGNLSAAQSVLKNVEISDLTSEMMIYLKKSSRI